MELDPRDPARAHRPGGVHLEHERRVPDGARLPRRAADLRAARARRRLPARSRSSWASRCRSRPSPCSRGSSIERRMLRRPVGALAMAGAAIDDVTAWGLLALATAVAGSGLGRRRARRRRAGRRLHRGDDRSSAARSSAASRPPTTRSGTCRRSGSAIIFVGVLLVGLRRRSRSGSRRSSARS